MVKNIWGTLRMAFLKMRLNMIMHDGPPWPAQAKTWSWPGCDLRRGRRALSGLGQGLNHLSNK
jgi:hypothetical protein